jgi:glycosyltransferase involved in cell wall biosynthesis
VTGPLLSVVIPTWNRAQLVCEAVESALVQRIGQVEVIVVDDGSTDDTAARLADRFGSKIRLVRMPRRSGPGAARNAGVGLAHGEWLAFLDSDDLWLPGKLDAELRQLERYPQADAIVSDALSFRESVPDDLSRLALNGLLAASRGQVRWLSDCEWLWTNSQNGVATCSIMLRRSVIERLPDRLFAEDLVCCEDWEFEMRVYHTCRVVVLPEVLAHVRRFDDGTRVDRAISGNPPTRQQEIALLRDRMVVMDRSQWLIGLAPHLAVEMERYRAETANRLARFRSAS